MDSSVFVLFGATGDLAHRKLFPALYNLHLEGKLPRGFAIVGLGRKPFSEEQFRGRVKEALARFSRRGSDDSAAQAEFLRLVHYQILEADRAEDYKRLLDRVEGLEREAGIPGNRLFYLSVSPDWFASIARLLKESGLTGGPGWKRLAVEKPFGRDLASARELNRSLLQAFPAEDIRYVDHYLGKPMVQNLQAFISANPVLKAVLNNRYVANVQITASETLGVGERAGYYDRAGAVRDMFQNHMLQLLMMTAMHSDVYDKQRILESAIPIQAQDAANFVVRGQYGPGELEGRKVPGYLDEPGVAAGSRTDTFFAARLELDDPVWGGVPFFIRTGKRMSEKSTRIIVEFRDPLEKYSHGEPKRNYLAVRIQPEESVELQLNLTGADGGAAETRLRYSIPEGELPEAYERLLHDALSGDASFFAKWPEIEASWRWLAPILEAFEDDRVPLHVYAAGTDGPEAANRLLERYGFKWL